MAPRDTFQRLDRLQETDRRVRNGNVEVGDEAEQLLAQDSLAHSHEKEESPRRRDRVTSAKYSDQFEEGPQTSSGNSSPASSVVDLRALNTRRPKRKPNRCVWCLKLLAIATAITALFTSLLYGAYRASGHERAQSKTPLAQRRFNGTHEFDPTTILISLDGFRADFLHRNLTPSLQSLMRSGVSPKYMTPSFPSITFPNHYTLVTGQYPESHGIVGNNFYDPDLKSDFYYTNPAKSMQPGWWTAAEPLWVTAEKEGVRTAIHMWPGSEAHIPPVEPAYVDKYNGDELLDRKVQKILGWLDLPGPTDTGAKADSPRPQLIAAYVPDVDSDGHRFGPNSTYIRSTIRLTDAMIGSLLQGLEDRNLSDIVNVIVVSDHGMATVQNVVQLEDLVDRSLIEYSDGWPLHGLRPYDSAKVPELHASLVAKSKLDQYKDAFDVYLRDEDMPPAYHFSNNDRIAPLWIVPRVGWAIATKDEYDVSSTDENQMFHPRGLHGYNHEHPLMRSIFVAKGPAFPHEQGSMVDWFQNIEVYNIVCDSLGIEPRPNNGTLRLPLKIQGKHDFEAMAEELVDVAHVFNRPDFVVPIGETPPPVAAGTEDGSQREGEGEEEEDQHALDRFLAWTSSSWQSFKDWASSLISDKESSSPS